MVQSSLFASPMTRGVRSAAEDLIIKHHYTHCLPSGKSFWFSVFPAIVVFSIPANKNIGRFLLGTDCECWELSRLWASDQHEPNLLTRAIGESVRTFAEIRKGCTVLVSYADPNHEHSGGIYRAASWVFTGVSEETRYYVDANGQSAARRKFHSGDKHLTKAEIEGLGFTQQKRPGKLRFARGLSASARRTIESRFDSATVR